LYEDAMNAFSRAIAIDGEAQSYSHRGLTFFKLGKEEEAIKDFNMAIEK
jgi:tetratricopeptide (TPR) repeat protein